MQMTSQIENGGVNVENDVIEPLRMPWDSNPVLSSKRKQFQTVVDGQSRVGVQDFVNDVGCVEPSPSVESIAGQMEHALKRARLSKCDVTPDKMRFKALTMLKVMIASDRLATSLGSQTSDPGDEPMTLSASLRDALASKATTTIYKSIFHCGIYSLGFVLNVAPVWVSLNLGCKNTCAICVTVAVEQPVVNQSCRL